jgi:alkaline phosphatase
MNIPMKKKILYSLFALLFLGGCRSDENVKFESKFYHYSVSQKPKNIILFIGDGMGLSQVYAAMIANKGSLKMLEFPVMGLSKTGSANSIVTDSGAGGTAIATGNKTNNGSIGVIPNGSIAKSILEYAEENLLSTGILVTSSVTHATPASFIAHVDNRNLEDSIATFYHKTDIDVFIGGGLSFFSNRSDGRNLIDSLLVKNYQVVYSLEEFIKFDSGKLAGLVSRDHCPSYKEGRGEMLPKSVGTAINILDNNKKGFFLMVEGSQIDWGGHANDINYIVEELIDFDKAVAVAYNFAMNNKETLVIVTADHETGGLTITDGNIQTGKVDAVFSTKGHTGTPVPVYAYGPGAEIFTGIYENTEIFNKMMYLYGFKK